MEISGNRRYFVHHFPSDRGPSAIELASLRNSTIPRLRSLLIDQLKRSVENDMGTIYSGDMGLLYTLFLLDDAEFGRFSSLLKTSQVRGCSFLHGSMFPAIIRGDLEELEKYVMNAQKLPKDECELLYGRAGCLHGLLLAQKLHPRLHLEAFILILVREIFEAGKTSAGFLMWSWHGSEYLGAIHGIAGILYVLLSCSSEVLAKVNPEIEEWIHQTVEDILSHYLLPSGNVRSSRSSHSDRLVQFCHGATGWIPLLCRLQGSYFSQQALRFGEVVWQRGLLASKGPGICHGIGGSICAFLDLYKHTRDDIWIRRAQWFAVFLGKSWEQLIRKADHPMSLFEGAAGAWFAIAMTSKNSFRSSSCFPGLGV